MNSHAKLEELILYFANRLEDEPAFGVTKLFKLLYFVDFLSFRAYGDSVTGEEYWKLEHGPAPKRGLAAIEAMKQKGLCVERRRDHFGRPQKTLVPLREADLACFTARDIDLANVILERFSAHNAARLSELSHDDIGWRAAGLKETIPYHTAMISDPLPPSEEELEFARELMQDRRDEVALR